MSLRGLAASSAFHAVILMLLVFGLPSFLDPEPLPQPLVMSVEILPPGPTNVENKDTAQKKKTEEPPRPRDAVKSTKEPVSKPVEKPIDKPIEKPVEKPVEKPIVKEPIKPIEEPVEKPTEKKDKVEEPSLEDILKDLKKDKKTPPAPVVDSPSGTPADGPKSISEAPFDPNSPAAMELKDNIRNQLMPCFIYSGGAPEDKIMAAKIQVTINKDGSISSAKLHSSQAAALQSNGYFRAIAEAGIRATRNPSCTPLKNLPADKYHMWKSFDIIFDPRMMM